MATSSLSFKCAVITGGSGGLGYAMAEHLLGLGKKVIIVGRTESKLQTAAKQLGHSTPYYVLDTGSIQDIPSFVSRVTKEHSETDCLINNAGIQRPFQITQDFDLARADQEIDINIRGPLHLCIKFLPHFRTKTQGAVIMNVSSVLGYIPTSVINPVYNGTKAWVHFWSMNLRTQLAQDPDTKHIKVIEIAPPSVGTDLHRERNDPDDNKKYKNPNSLSVAEFMDDLVKGWEEVKDTIGAGPSQKVVDRWYGEFGEDYKKVAG